MFRVTTLALLVTVGLDAADWWVNLSADASGRIQLVALLLIAWGVLNNSSNDWTSKASKSSGKFGGNFINVSFGDKKGDE